MNNSKICVSNSFHKLTCIFTEESAIILSSIPLVSEYISLLSSMPSQFPHFQIPPDRTGSLPRTVRLKTHDNCVCVPEWFEKYKPKYKYFVNHNVTIKFKLQRSISMAKL